MNAVFIKVPGVTAETLNRLHQVCESDATKTTGNDHNPIGRRQEIKQPKRAFAEILSSRWDKATKTYSVEIQLNLKLLSGEEQRRDQFAFFLPLRVLRVLFEAFEPNLLHDEPEAVPEIAAYVPSIHSLVRELDEVFHPWLLPFDIKFVGARNATGETPTLTLRKSETFHRHATWHSVLLYMIPGGWRVDLASLPDGKERAVLGKAQIAIDAAKTA